METLSVVNRMLGTMGEAPLNSLEESHALLSAMQGALDSASDTIQADGWWFNMEDLDLTPNPTDQSVYLPNDCLSVRTPKYNLVKRGNRIYNLTGGTYVFTESKLSLEMNRLVPFEDLPEIAAAYIANQAILDFQADYDGDTAKARQLSAKLAQSKVAAETAHIRNRRRNLISQNSRLQQLKSVTRDARRTLISPGQ